jgi:putative modified peptide
MDQQVVSTLMDKWMNDEAFRAALRKDPESAIRATGVQLDEDQWNTVRSIDWNSSNEELAARASKSLTCG